MQGEPISVLILGGGGREHAIATALLASPSVGRLYAAPGSDAMAAGGVEVIAADASNADEITHICSSKHIDLVVCGPEAPLAAGVGDALRAAGVAFFGPGASGARLESSKVFAKSFMARHGVPTAPFDICESVEQCRAAIARRQPPFVIKADGLAAGKGVFLPDDAAEAESICAELIERKKLGGAGDKIVIEDFTHGRELTLFALTDGDAFEILPPSRDHKRVFDGDKGPNTGGMGAYSPVAVPDGFVELAVGRVLRPTLAGLKADGIDYRGVLYMGLMITPEGGVSVVEYNARFGDPETQVVLPLYDGDIGAAMYAAACGRLRAHIGGESRIVRPNGCALGVVLASGGYPGSFAKGHVISGLDLDTPEVIVIHSGTKRSGDDFVTNGGRVLTVVGRGATFDEARARAYARAERIAFADMHMRSDIGWSEGK